MAEEVPLLHVKAVGPGDRCQEAVPDEGGDPGSDPLLVGVAEDGILDLCLHGVTGLCRGDDDGGRGTGDVVAFICLDKDVGMIKDDPTIVGSGWHRRWEGEGPVEGDR